MVLTHGLQLLIYYGYSYEMSMTNKLVANSNDDMRIPYSIKKQILSTYEKNLSFMYGKFVQKSDGTWLFSPFWKRQSTSI